MLKQFLISFLIFSSFFCFYFNFFIYFLKFIYFYYVLFIIHFRQFLNLYLNFPAHKIVHNIYVALVISTFALIILCNEERSL